jgi:hypothetical protein
VTSLHRTLPLSIPGRLSRRNRSRSNKRRQHSPHTSPLLQTWIYSVPSVSPCGRRRRTVGRTFCDRPSTTCSSSCEYYSYKDRLLHSVANPGDPSSCRLCWDAGATSPAHSHGGSQCFIRVLQGSLRERVFRFRSPSELGTPLALISDAVIDAGGVSFMNDDLGLHEVSVGQRTMSLYLYVPGYDQVRARHTPALCAK